MSDSGGFADFPTRYLGRPWVAEDGLTSNGLQSMLDDRGVTVPGSLREFYETLGSCTELLGFYAEIHLPGALSIENGWLVFAEENQGVVSWGFPAASLGEADPTVWQRTNHDGLWYDEELALRPFLSALFDFAVYGEDGSPDSTPG